MPKKTKKAKLKSLERRGNTAPTTISETHIPTNPIEPVHHTFSFRSNTAQAPTSSTLKEVSKNEYAYLKKDLLKTVILAIFACGILVGLSIFWK